MAKTTPKKDATVVKTADELQKDLAAKQQDLVEAKRSLKAGELVNPRVLGTTRKDIARILTQINATKEAK